MRRMRRLEKVVTRRDRISSADALQESVLPDRETIFCYFFFLFTAKAIRADLARSK